jgi:hypothetical protein
MGPIQYNAILLRKKEKDILYSSLSFLDNHEAKVRNGSIPFQLELKAMERVEADLREAEYQKFVSEVKAKASAKKDLAVLEVNMGDSVPKANLTLVEGADIKVTVANFMHKHNIPKSNFETLEKALRGRVRNPAPLQLLLGVITNLGDRQILGIPDGVNATVETGVFCAKFDNSKDVLSSKWCKSLIERVNQRLFNLNFQRKVLLVVPVDAPDSRKLQLVLHEGEQHDLVQFVADFFEFYHLPSESVNMMAEVVNKRLRDTVLTIPIHFSAQRQVVIRFSLNDNVTNVVEAFSNFYEIDPTMKVAIYKRARHGMAPGTFLV